MKVRSCARLVLVFALALLCAKKVWAQLPSDRPKESSARGQVEQLIQQTGAQVAVAFRSLDGSQDLFLHADEAFPAVPATIQVPVMIELYAEAQSGTLHLSDTVVVHNSFHSLVDGVTYQLDPKNDPDPGLYNSIGRPVTLQDLCEHMVARNSSLAADLLIEKLGVPRVRQRIEALHANGIELFRGLEPSKASDTKPENETTARAMLELLWALAKGQQANDDSSKQMMGMIARAAFEHAPTAGMPSDPRAAQSVRLAGTGQQAMIVLGPHPYVIVILVRGITNPETSAELMAQITHALAAAIT
jgi:beta-lactamase class A